MEAFATGISRKEKIKETDRQRQEAAAKDTSIKKQTSKPAGGSAMLNKALKQLDEQEDDVKGFNTLMLHSKVLTIRDKQIAEN